MDMIDLDED